MCALLPRCRRSVDAKPGVLLERAQVESAGMVAPVVRPLQEVALLGRNERVLMFACQDVLRTIAVEIVPLVLVVELVLGTNGQIEFPQLPCRRPAALRLLKPIGTESVRKAFLFPLSNSLHRLAVCPTPTAALSSPGS